ncbi:MAG: hypothetical protein I3274_02535 [Candidatus Moeniiplasma glomeromycotorum]|nr:hypothetical protein [Candidatus Moeniiplasma glomeromycotorum]MCE8167485.1 hypothetical protein [Candidatus Moeniiplasma glomeromycotorum]
MRSHKSVEQAKLAEQLENQVRRKNQAIKRLVWGIGLGVFNLVLDGLYNALLILVGRGDLKADWGLKLVRFLNDNFSILFIIWLLSWVGAAALVIWGLNQWLAAHEEIETLKLKLN